MEPLTADDPRQVSVYRLQSRLGAGGMGRVYLAASPGGRAVALKVVHPELARDPEFMQRFRREVEAAEAVSGAYTAPVLGAGPDDSPPWLATAYVPGPSLAELVAGSGPLPEAAVWRLAGGLTEALQAIHGRGLVHRDLKPGNILVAADGPRVIDFGISRALHGIAITGRPARTMGTPAYMSPEQAAGSEHRPGQRRLLARQRAGLRRHRVGPVRRRRHVRRSSTGSCTPSRTSAAAARAARPGRPAAWPRTRPPGRRLGTLLAAVDGRRRRSRISRAPGQFWPDPVAAAITRQAAPARPGPGPRPGRRTAAGPAAPLLRAAGRARPPPPWALRSRGHCAAAAPGRRRRVPADRAAPPLASPSAGAGLGGRRRATVGILAARAGAGTGDARPTGTVARPAPPAHVAPTGHVGDGHISAGHCSRGVADRHAHRRHRVHVPG